MFFPVLFTVSLSFCFLLAFVSVPLFYVLAEPLGMAGVSGETGRPTPRTGGLAVFPAFLITSFLFCRFCRIDRFLLTLFCGGAAMLLLGALDDAYDLPRLPKVLIGAAVSCVSVSMLFPASELSFPSRLPFFFWIFAVTFSHGLVCGKKEIVGGLAGGLAGVEAVAVCAHLLTVGAYAEARASLFLSVALSAFLLYDRRPARIVLGNAGALSVGYILSLLTLRGTLRATDGATNGPLLLRVLTPVLLVALPLAELVRRVFSRLRAKIGRKRIRARAPQTDAAGLLLLSGCLGGTGLLLLTPVGCAPALLPLSCGIAVLIGKVVPVRAGSGDAPRPVPGKNGVGIPTLS